MEPEFKAYPLAPHLRVSRDGRVESCRTPGPNGRNSSRWRPLKVHCGEKRGRLPTIAVTQGGGKVKMVPLREILATTWPEQREKVEPAEPQAPYLWPATVRLVDGCWSF